MQPQQKNQGTRSRRWPSQQRQLQTLTATFRLMTAVLSLQLVKQNLVFLQNEKGLLLEVPAGETQRRSKGPLIRTSTHPFTHPLIPELSV